MDMWAWLWTGWAVVTLLSFFAIEIPAYRNGVPGDTLSEQVWVVLKAEGMLKPFRRIIRLSLIFFFTWLILHFFTGYV